MLYVMVLFFSVYFSILWARGERKSVLLWGLAVCVLLEKVSRRGEGFYFLAMTSGFVLAFDVCVRHRMNRVRTFFVVVIGVFFIDVLLQGIQVYVFHRIPDIYLWLNLVIQANQTFLHSSGYVQKMTIDARFQVEAAYTIIAQSLAKSGPYALFMTLSIYVMGSVEVLRRKLKIKALAQPVFREWKWPEEMIFFLILGWGMTLLGKKIMFEQLTQLGLNIREIAEWLYLLQGIAIVTSWLHKTRMGGILKALLYISLLPIRDVVCYLGVLDTWVDTRRLQKEVVKNESHFKG